MASRVKATVVEGVLSVFGRADERVFGQSVWVEVFENGQVVVEDRSGRNVIIPVTSDGSTITSAVLDGIPNAGVFFRSTLPSLTSVTGTNRDDVLVISVAEGSYLTKGGDGDDQLRIFGSGRLLGEKGDDQIILGNGAAVAWGGVGNDELNGGTKDDRLKGGSGDDTINGGEGRDVAIYTGARADYEIELVDGVYHLTDLRALSPDGHDTLVNVEVLRFSDGNVQIEDALPNPAPLSDFWI